MSIDDRWGSEEFYFFVIYLFCLNFFLWYVDTYHFFFLFISIFILIYFTMGGRGVCGLLNPAGLGILLNVHEMTYLQVWFHLYAMN